VTTNIGLVLIELVLDDLNGLGEIVVEKLRIDEFMAVLDVRHEPDAGCVLVQPLGRFGGVGADVAAANDCL